MLKCHFIKVRQNGFGAVFMKKNESLFFTHIVNMDEYYDEGYDGAEIVENVENEEDYEDGEGDDEFRPEFGAFDRAGHLRVFAENEQDQFFNNMEHYAYINKVPTNMEVIRREFSVLARHYPHPRCLNPGACYSMSEFRSRGSGRYEWDSEKYSEQRFHGITKYTLIRYIAIFNKYALHLDKALP
jgi:hypothetical protein